ncbi:serine/threonine protein kinase, partial [Streptomyces sp. NPDC000658]
RRAPRPRGAVLAGAFAVAALTGVLAWALLPHLGKGASDDGASPAPGAAVSSNTSAAPAGRQTARAGSGTSGGAAAEKVDLLGGDGVERTVAKLTAAMGGSKVTSLAVYEEYAIAEAPVVGRPRLYDRYTYRGGDVAVKDGPGGTVMTGTVPVDLRLYDWDAVPALLARAGRTLGVPAPTSRYLLVNPASTVFDTEPTMSVYLSDDYGSAYLKADVHGRVIETHPRDDG